MPLYDTRCDTCGTETLDVFESVNEVRPRCPCGGIVERAWLTKPPTTIGDECDEWIRHGICHEDGSPRHYRSKAEMKRVAAEKGLVNRVRHLGTKSGDRSKHTTRWI